MILLNEYTQIDDLMHTQKKNVIPSLQYNFRILDIKKNQISTQNHVFFYVYFNLLTSHINLFYRMDSFNQLNIRIVRNF